ncbi:MAG: hypothetical protein ACD_34C00499G0002 [uncultured bacterium]|nr:MAG: hypothetical protein ACD_34C00499G0002 [uncultured bacterium]
MLVDFAASKVLSASRFSSSKEDEILKRDSFIVPNNSEISASIFLVAAVTPFEAFNAGSIVLL